MRESSDEKIAIKGILYITLAEVLAMLFFIFVNGGF
jgi:hypothetical protein